MPDGALMHPGAIGHRDLYAQEPFDDRERQEDDVEWERQLEARVAVRRAPIGGREAFPRAWSCERARADRVWSGQCI